MKERRNSFLFPFLLAFSISTLSCYVFQHDRAFQFAHRVGAAPETKLFRDPMYGHPAFCDAQE
jgi:hypothetical protein